METKQKKNRQTKVKTVKETSTKSIPIDVQTQEKNVILNDLETSVLDDFKISMDNILGSFDKNMRVHITNHSINNQKVFHQHLEVLNNKINNLEQQNNELIEKQRNHLEEQNQLHMEKTNTICENVKLKDRILVLESIHKKTSDELDESNRKILTIKSQFEEYKVESTNSYSLLKGLYNDSKVENSVFLTKLEKITKDYEIHRNESNKYKLESTDKIESISRENQICKSELSKLASEWDEKVQNEIQSFKNVSILNTYLKEIDSLKNEISILNQKLATNKKFLEQSQKDNKELNNKLETISAPEEPNDQQEQLNEILEEVVEEQEDIQEIDSSKFDIIEVDEKEYYLDLDNNILDIETLEIIGTVTEDGEAIFNENHF